MAAVAIEPRWLQSTKIMGLDQLGVQLVSISIYSELLPGITNVTDRVRYYSFYPWIIHRYATDIKKDDRKTWREHLRRAEFLLALVGRAHHADGGEGGEALVGADLATRVIAELREEPNRKWKISTWTALSQIGKENSYFQNRDGGFGQYYKGQLAETDLLRLTETSPGVQLTLERGRRIAEDCDQQSGRDEFWKAVMKDEVSFVGIESWGDTVCPCSLTKRTKERDLLLEAVFKPRFQGDSATGRRADTLRILLSFLSQTKRADESLNPWAAFRPSAYYGHDRTGTPIHVPTGLEEVAERWRIYQAGEYVHLALEEIFHAVLEHLREADRAPVAQLATDLAAKAMAFTSKDLELGSGNAPWSGRTLQDLVKEAKGRQGSPDSWDKTFWSEEKLLDAAFLVRTDDEDPDPSRGIALSFAAIISVVAREFVPSDPFGKFQTLGPEFPMRHRVNLASVRQFLNNRLQKPAAEACADLIQELILNQHLQVAMRKLRHQLQATFKFTVEEGHYVWVEQFIPTFTNPRLRQAFLFLRDLGLATGKSDGWKLTSLGKTILREGYGE